VGKLPALLPPAIPDGIPPRMDAIPALGEHTNAILHELGYGDVEIEELRRLGAV